ncbi:MAG: hypothetical protein WBQ08_05900 [Candidatus Sulfotelmatobacter sp.]
MSIRDEVRALFDELPEDKLQTVRAYLNGLLRPHPLRAENLRSRDQAQKFQMLVEQRFNETRKPGTISFMLGGGSLFPKDGESCGRHSFHYWDDKALVHQTLQFFAGQELEIMERFSRSDDGGTLVYEQEMHSGGRTLRNKIEFPFLNGAKTGNR